MKWKLEKRKIKSLISNILSEESKLRTLVLNDLAVFPMSNNPNQSKKTLVIFTNDSLNLYSNVPMDSRRCLSTNLSMQNFTINCLTPVGLYAPILNLKMKLSWEIIYFILIKGNKTHTFLYSYKYTKSFFKN